MKRNKVYGLLFILISISVLYFQTKRFISGEIQAKVFFDTNAQNFNERDLYFIYSIDDFYPSLNTFAMPMKALKAKYLIGKDSIRLAIDYFLQASKENPYIMFSESELAQVYLNLGDFQMFEKYTRKAIKGIPNNAIHFVNYAKLMTQLEKVDSLMYYFNKIQDKIGDRDHQTYLITLSGLYGDSLLMEKYKAKEIAKKAVSSFPQHPQIRLISDYIFYSKENVELAKEKHDKAREIFDTDQDQSLRLFSEALQLHPNNQQYNDNYILANYQFGNFKAIADLYPSYKEYFIQLDSNIMYYLSSSLYIDGQIKLGCEILSGLDDANLFVFDRNNFPECYNYTSE